MVGLCAGLFQFAASIFATEGWMIYPIWTVGAFRRRLRLDQRAFCRGVRARASRASFRARWPLTALSGSPGRF